MALRTGTRSSEITSLLGLLCGVSHFVDFGFKILEMGLRGLNFGEIAGLGVKRGHPDRRNREKARSIPGPEAHPLP